jgi:hypothetical protein
MWTSIHRTGQSKRQVQKRFVEHLRTFKYKTPQNSAFATHKRRRKKIFTQSRLYLLKINQKSNPGSEKKMQAKKNQKKQNETSKFTHICKFSV